MTTQIISGIKKCPSHTHNGTTKTGSHTADAVWIGTPETGSHEIFQTDIDGVQFRTVSWQRAAVVFVKIQFAMSILSVPAALSTIGAIGGSLSVIGWSALNTCMSKL